MCLLNSARVGDMAGRGRVLCLDQNLERRNQRQLEYPAAAMFVRMRGLDSNPVNVRILLCPGTGTLRPLNLEGARLAAWLRTSVLSRDRPVPSIERKAPNILLPFLPWPFG